MASVFWDNKAILLEEYFPITYNVNKYIYFDILIKLRQAIKAKHPGKLNKMIVLLHDNTWPRIAQVIKTLPKQ